MFNAEAKLNRILKVFTKAQQKLDKFVEQCIEAEQAADQAIAEAKHGRDSVRMHRQQAEKARTKIAGLLGEEDE